MRRRSLRYILRLLVWHLDLGSAILLTWTKRFYTAKLLSSVGDAARSLSLQIGKPLLDIPSTAFNVAQLDAFFHILILSRGDALANDSTNVWSLPSLLRAPLLDFNVLCIQFIDSFKPYLLQLFIRQLFLRNFLDRSEICRGRKLLHVLIVLDRPILGQPTTIACFR